MKVFLEMAPARLDELLGRFGKLRVAVLGDYFLDKYLDVESSLVEVSVETGKPAHQVVGVRHSPGAAGTIVANLAALGAGELHAVGYTGDDGSSYDLRKGLSNLGCSTNHLRVAPGRMTPTYLKPRDRTVPSLAGEHPRYDAKNRTPTSEEIERQVIESLDELLESVDAVTVLDQVEEQDCGVVTSRVVDALAERSARSTGTIFWADSRRHVRQFRRVIVKCNQFEVAGWTDPRPGDAVPPDELTAALRSLRTTNGAPVCVTRGPEGMLVTDPEPMIVPGVSVDGPTDETGAGDSATAGAVLALAAGGTLAEAALIGNLVASIIIQQLATTGTARLDQLPPRLELWRQQRAVG